MTENSATWTDRDGNTHIVIASGSIAHQSSPRTKALIDYVVARADFVCQHCGARKGPTWEARLEIDHIIPWRDGGTNHPDNLQALCHKCNKAKTRWERLWRENLEMGTPNDYSAWEKRYVPAGYLRTVFKPDASAECGHGGVM